MMRNLDLRQSTKDLQIFKIKQLFAWKFDKAVILVFVIYTLFKSWSMIHNKYFWYDESGQFWMAQGLNHYSPPLAPRGDTYEALLSNSRYSFDPGGFTLIVRLWCTISTNYLWIRFLPELFFYGALIAIYLILRHLRLSIRGSVFVLFCVNFGIPGYNQAFFRPYSADLCAFAFAFLFLLHFLSQKSEEKIYLPRLIWMSAFGIWMRYDGFVWTAALLLSIISLRSKCLFSKTILSWKLWTACIIFLGSCLAIYFFSFLTQSRVAIQMYYDVYLRNSPNFIINRYNLVYFICLLGIYLYPIFLSRKNSNHQLKELQKVCLVLSVIYIFFSEIGLYPWAPWSAVDIPIPLCFLILGAATFSRQLLYFERLVPLICLSAIMLYLAFLAHMHMCNFKAPRAPENITNYLAKQHNLCAGKQFLVDAWDSPALRFYFEVENPSLQRIYQYPEKFTFLPPSNYSNEPNKFLSNSIKKFCALDIPTRYKNFDLSQWDNVVSKVVWQNNLDSSS